MHRPLVTLALLMSACQQAPPATLSAECRVPAGDLGERVVLRLRLKNETDQPIEYLALDPQRPAIDFSYPHRDRIHPREIDSILESCGLPARESQWQTLAPGAEFSFLVNANSSIRPLQVGLEGLRLMDAEGAVQAWSVWSAPIVPDLLPLVEQAPELPGVAGVSSGDKE